jgi:putative ABC transport system permease protein
MFARILINDMKRKKGMNIILFIFILLSTMFLASSINEICTISSALDHYIKKADVADYTSIAIEHGDSLNEVDQWLKESNLVKNYDTEEILLISKDNIKIKGNKEYHIGRSLGMQVNPKKYSKVFDESGKEFTLSDGEVAINKYEAINNNLKKGDTLVFNYGDVTKECVIKYIIKDTVFGMEAMPFSRMIINDQDYGVLRDGDDTAVIEKSYLIKTSNVDKFTKKLNAKGFQLAFSFGQDLVRNVYLPDMLLASMLIVASICLIIISFLILSFVIKYTLQEDYHEIGVMKAIGLRDSAIRRLYMIKYLVLTISGALIGMLLSLLFSKILLNMASANILLENNKDSVSVSVLCAILIMFIIQLYCSNVFRKLKKISALKAVSGDVEIKKTKNNIEISKHPLQNLSLYLAMNKILHNFKNIVVLLVTFSLGIFLVVVTANIANTLGDKSMVNLFGIEKADVFFDTNEITQDTLNNRDKFNEHIRNMEQKYEDSGVPLSIYGDVCYTFSYYGSHKEDCYTAYTLQSIKQDSKCNIIKGKRPVEKDEVALTKKFADKLGIKIGDTVHVIIGKDDKEMTVTGYFQSMYNMGDDVRLNNQLQIDYMYVNSIYDLEGSFSGEKSNNFYLRKLKDSFKDEKFRDCDEFMVSLMGDVVDQIGKLKGLLLLLILMIYILITTLTIKSFILREQPEIAMQKCIGFNDKNIQFNYWLRITIILLVSMLLGLIVSLVIGNSTVQTIFTYLGASNMKIIVNPLEVYLVYPGIMFLVTGVVSWLCTLSVQKVNVNQINQMH